MSTSTISEPILFKDAAALFLEAKRAQRLSPNTLIDYGRTLRKLEGFLPSQGKVPVDQITPADIRRFMTTLVLGKKTLLNVHVGLSAFWTWMVKEGLCNENIMRKVDRPRPEIRIITPFSKEEVEKLFSALEQSREYSRPGKKSCKHRIPNYWRNRAILLLLLDTGMRASELCGLRFKDFIDKNHIRVFGKGSKERILPLSSATLKAIEDYVDNERLPIKGIGAYVFVTRSGKPLKATDLYHRILKIGERVGVHAHPHRFRHTFAINFLRNGGDIYTLQAILGHSTLEMVKRYLAIARIDIESAHRKASPVVCWALG
jgi:site-specific recombinase XerD